MVGFFCFVLFFGGEGGNKATRVSFWLNKSMALAVWTAGHCPSHTSLSTVDLFLLLGLTLAPWPTVHFRRCGHPPLCDHHLFDRRCGSLPPGFRSCVKVEVAVLGFPS